MKCHARNPKLEYFGVEVPVDLITKNIANTEMAQLILPIMFTRETGGGE
jgi:hypothetical protein